MCLGVLSCIYAMPLLRTFSCGFNLEEVDMRVMLGHVPYQTTTHLSLGVPLPREYASCCCHHLRCTSCACSCSCRYISGRLPAYHNLQSLTWCISSLSEKQQTSFSKSVIALMGNGLAFLTLFCDEHQPAPSDQEFKKFREASSFSIKSIVVGAAAHKQTVKQISFVRLSLHPPCVQAVFEAPSALQRCLNFHGECLLVSQLRAIPAFPPPFGRF